jgi:hypothetical protein
MPRPRARLAPATNRRRGRSAAKHRQPSVHIFERTLQAISPVRLRVHRCGLARRESELDRLSAWSGWVRAGQGARLRACALPPSARRVLAPSGCPVYQQREGDALGKEHALARRSGRA